MRIILDFIAGILESSRSFLQTALPLFFTISFILIIISLVLDFPRIKRQFKIRRSTWILLALIFLLGIFLRASTPVYLTTCIDEFSHIETGKNIAKYGIADMCHGLIDSEGMSCYLFNEPAGFPYVVGMFFLFLGVSETSAYMVNLIMGSLLAVIVFLFSLLLFKSEKIGLYGAFLVSVLPLYILLSRNIEPDTVSAFFIMLTFIGFILFFKIKDLKMGVFAVSILAFSMSIKQENILLPPLVLFLSFLFLDIKYLKQTIKNYRLWVLVLLFIILVTPHIFHLSLEIYPALFYGKPTATAVGGRLINLGNIFINAQILSKVIRGSFYPLLINLFIIVGLFYALKKHRKGGVFLILFFSLYMFVYLAYSATIVEKYLITALVPLVCFAGVGMYAIERFTISKLQVVSKRSVISYAIPLVIVFVIIMFSLPYFHEIREDLKPLDVNHGYPRNGIQYREKEVVNMIDKKIDSCYIIAEQPVFFSASDLKAIPTDSVLQNPQLLEKVISEGKCLFYFEDLYCTDFYSLGDRCGIENESIETCEQLRREIVRKCRKMHEKFELETYKEFEINLSEKYAGLKPEVIEGGSFAFRLYKINSVKS